ncbi:sulfatase-like hydrolase/transferase [Lentisphaera profundi]|uniref:Sulfatase-like hydrolase/transferase n=1 Tax=Lentisphaera profundi TaxID=1658616 RepID=A0ABY7VNC9_9BACT|nr:sulfatase-like hydrolase/transferase [Lentisphaera profundi]WDE95610.1 sulfatase-like hydrolase/transferase [Lentisphaera profundi]
MKNIFYIVLAFTFAFFAKGERPNIIIILSDDAGYGDFGYMGSTEFKTPHIDEMVSEGIQFSNAYVTACMCAPSRAGLITGKYQQKLGFHLNLPHNYNHSFGLRTSQKTLADYMKNAGYKTAAFGKWHLGHEKRYHPNQRGFDYFYGFAAGHRSYFSLEEPDKSTLAYRMERNGEYLEEADDFYMSDALTSDAISFISKNKEEEFLIYLAFSAVHYPMHAKEQDLKVFEDIKDTNRKILAAMTKSMDDNVGRLRQALKDMDLEENTLLWFLNDNGGAYNNFSDNGVLRGGKGGLSEGGIRVPTAIVWPGKLSSGIKMNHPISSLDIAPSILAMAGEQVLDLDGKDILSPIIQKNDFTERDLFWASQEIYAMRRSNYKLIRVDFSKGPKFWLFDLELDPGEQVNLAESAKSRVQEMNQSLNKWIRTHKSADFRKNDYLKDSEKEMRLREWMKFN